MSSSVLSACEPGAGQQSLMPRVSAVTEGFGGGQLMEVLMPACGATSDAAVLTSPSAWAGFVPLWQPVSVHSMADAATGGEPLMHLGLVQALAAVAVRPSEPAVRAAEIAAPAATRLA